MGTLDPQDRQRSAAGDASTRFDPLAELMGFSHIAFLRRRLARGEILFNAGDTFHAIYAMKSGSLKIANTDRTGREQVTGFFIRSELLGLDGIAAGSYEGTASALEDSEIIVMPFALLQDLSKDNPAMQRQLFKVLSREIARDHGVMLLLGSMSAEARFATFLLNLSMRLSRQGYSPVDFRLRMSRAEIGSYIGLKLETVSRMFSAFHKRGLLEVNQKHVRILAPEGLRNLIAMH